MSVVSQDLKCIVDEGILSPEDFKGKNILLLGSTGMILSYVARFLVEMNEAYGLNMKIFLQGRTLERIRKRHAVLEGKAGVVFEAFDIANGIPSEISVDFIIHGASPANGAAFVTRPVDTILPNVQGTKAVLDYARSNNARVLYMSSTAIYGDVSGLDREYISESDYGIIDPLDERASYYESKRLGEQLCLAYFRQYKTVASIVRIPYTYGPSYELSADTRIFPKCIRKIVVGEDVEMFHEETLLQYTYSADVASALLLCLLKGKAGEAYNVCRMDGIAMEDMVKKVAEDALCKDRARVIIKKNDDNYYFHGKKTVNLQWMDNKKLESIGWKSCFDFDHGLKQTIRGVEEFNDLGALR